MYPVTAPVCAIHGIATTAGLRRDGLLDGLSQRPTRTASTSMTAAAPARRRRRFRA
jgi:hypothetical protein